MALCLSLIAAAFSGSRVRKRKSPKGSFGWHHLSNARCRMRPHLFHARFVVSRVTIICCIIRHV